MLLSSWTTVRVEGGGLAGHSIRPTSSGGPPFRMNSFSIRPGFENLDSTCSFDATPWSPPRRYTALAMKTFFAALAVVASAFIAYAAQTSQPAPRDVHALTIEQLIDIRHPSNAVWSPDGRLVAFLSDRAGIANIFVAEIDAEARPNRPAALTRFSDGLSGGLFWSADSQRVLLSAAGRPLAGRGRRRGADRRLGHSAAGVEFHAVTGSPAAGLRQGRQRPRRALAHRREGSDRRPRRRQSDRRRHVDARRRTPRLQRRRQHDPARADAGRIRARKSSTPSPSADRARPRRRRNRRRADAAPACRRRHAAGLDRPSALPRRSPVRRLQAAHDLRGRHRRRRAEDAV